MGDFQPCRSQHRGWHLSGYRFAKFDLAPGVFPTDPTIRSGLAFLDISYSDGEEGILIVSCHLVGTPDSVFEGVNASKGFVHYFNRVAPIGAFFQEL